LAVEAGSPPDRLAGATGRLGAYGHRPEQRLDVEGFQRLPEVRGVPRPAQVGASLAEVPGGRRCEALAAAATRPRPVPDPIFAGGPGREMEWDRHEAMRRPPDDAGPEFADDRPKQFPET